MNSRRILGLYRLSWTIPSKADQDGWVLGFDTCHSWDSLESKPKEVVEELTEQLKQYAIDAENNTLVCSVCEGTNVHKMIWVDANTEEYVNEAGSTWCEDCGDNHSLKLKSQTS